MTPINNKTEKPDLTPNLEVAGLDADLEQAGLVGGETPQGEARASHAVETNRPNDPVAHTSVQDQQPINQKTVKEALKKADKTVAEQRGMGVEGVISKVTNNDPNKTAGSQKAREFLFDQAQGTNAA